MSELGKFLRARRERVRPADVGLAPGVGARRTPGLRREELATLAGVSIDYYTRLERGRETRPSPAVLDALAAALRLDEESALYLHTLVSSPARQPARGSAPASRVRPTLGLLLDSVRPNPAYVIGRTNDMLAANAGGLALLPGITDWPASQRNTIRYTFLHPGARDLWPDWEQKARACVAQLRAVAGGDPDSPDLAALLGELLVKSQDFGRMWERYEVRRIGDGRKLWRHPAVGEMTLTYEVLDINRTDGQRMVIYMAKPGTPDHDAMVLLDNFGLTFDRSDEPGADQLTLRGGE
jgi:transcriptional regulator with XRE-family HTH domain